MRCHKDFTVNKFHDVFIPSVKSMIDINTLSSSPRDIGNNDGSVYDDIAIDNMTKIDQMKYAEYLLCEEKAKKIRQKEVITKLENGEDLKKSDDKKSDDK